MPFLVTILTLPSWPTNCKNNAFFIRLLISHSHHFIIRIYFCFRGLYLWTKFGCCPAPCHASPSSALHPPKHTTKQNKSIAPESALKRFQEIAASRQEEELEKYRIAMEREKEDRLRRVEEERARRVFHSPDRSWSKWIYVKSSSPAVSRKRLRRNLHNPVSTYLNQENVCCGRSCGPFCGSHPATWAVNHIFKILIIGLPWQI